MRKSLDYQYKHLVQKPSLCGPTCMQMVLLRRGVWMDQEQIAQEVGARILPVELKVFSLKLKFPKDPKDAGINLSEFKGKKIKTGDIFL